MVKDFIVIEKMVFDKMLEDFAKFVAQVEILCEKHRDKEMSECLNSESVCGILNIKPKTLNSYRKSGKIDFLQIKRKILYRGEDVQRLLDSDKDNLSIKK